MGTVLILPKIGSSLKPNNHGQITLVQILDLPRQGIIFLPEFRHMFELELRKSLKKIDSQVRHQIGVIRDQKLFLKYNCCFFKTKTIWNNPPW